MVRLQCWASGDVMAAGCTCQEAVKKLDVRLLSGCLEHARPLSQSARCVARAKLMAGRYAPDSKLNCKRGQLLAASYAASLVNINVMASPRVLAELERNAPPANLAAGLFEEELPHGKHHAQRPRPALVVEKQNRIFAARRKSRLRVVAGGVAGQCINDAHGVPSLALLRVGRGA